jgi:predicted GNAT family acetyltransferase
MMNNGYIDFTSTATLLDPEDAEDFHTVFSGEIFILDENGERIEIGAIDGTIIEIQNLINYRKTSQLFELLDSSQHIQDSMSTIWDYRNKRYSKEINPNNYYLGDTLILDKLYIYPEFNGNGYGLSVIQRTIEHFRRDTDTVVLLEAHPLQIDHDWREEFNSDKFNERMDLSRFESDKEKATKSLMNYYSKANFKRIKGTTYMYKLTDENLTSSIDEHLVNGRTIEVD